MHLERGVKNLWTLMMGGNEVEKFEHLRPLQSFPYLHHLDMLNNPIEDQTNFREEVFKQLP